MIPATEAPKMDPPALNSTTMDIVEISVWYKSVISNKVGPKMVSDNPCNRKNDTFDQRLAS